MGDQAFEAQMESNLRANRHKGRVRRGEVSPAEMRPDIRKKIDEIKGRDIASKLRHQQQRRDPAAQEAAAAAAAVAEAQKAVRKVRQGQIRRGGETTPVFCLTTSEAFCSITAAAKATGVAVFRVRRSTHLGIEVEGPDGISVSFRHWQAGDPPVQVRPMRKALPIRFKDGTCWPSATALITTMGATPAEGARFYRRLKKLGYGPSSEPLELLELRILANWLPALERQRLEDRIAAAEGCALTA
jgi:hypothetical protein